MIERGLAGLLGLGLLVNATVMLVAPGLWYAQLPGVSASGPLNLHFVRDLGCADLAAAIPFLARARATLVPRTALLSAAGFLCLHMGVHLYELLAASDGGHRFVGDLLTLYAPAFLAAWLAARPATDSAGPSRVIGRLPRADGGGGRSPLVRGAGHHHPEQAAGGGADRGTLHTAPRRHTDDRPGDGADASTLRPRRSTPPGW